MTRYVFLALCAATMVLGGCAMLDSFFGVDETGVDLPGDSTAEGVSNVVGTILPGSAAVLTALGGIYAAIRGRKWKQAAVSTFEVIEQGSKSVKEVKALKKDLKVAHEAAGVMGMVKAVLSKKT